MKWDDALYDFHVTHLPTRLFISINERSGLFKPKCIGEVSFLLTGSLSSDVHAMFEGTNGCSLCVSWEVSENISIPAFQDQEFPPLLLEREAEVRTDPPYKVFAGTWNVV